MEKKKRIGLLTFLVFIAGIVIAILDAVVSVHYDVVPEQPSGNFWELVISGPIWWKINPVIIITIISVGVIAFLLGSDVGTSIRPSKALFELMPVFLTFVTISFSGLGDIISQTFIEYMTGNSPLNWLHKEWWWTRFMPIPALIAFLAGHSVPSGTDMVIGSIVGIVILGAMWFYYYKPLNFRARIGEIWRNVIDRF
ncbi:MAG: hypothetical protein ACETVP_03100 [Candidatus Bathyarchaeia archaeon]